MQAVLQRATRLLATIAASALFSGCMTTAVLTFVVDKAQEGEPTPCHSLNSVQRARIGRCGRYEAGSLVAKDVMASGLPRCPLVVAAREPRFWPVLPELLAKGALPEACD